MRIHCKHDLLHHRVFPLVVFNVKKKQKIAEIQVKHFIQRKEALGQV